MWKTLKELKQINTYKLLKYYKAERKRFYNSGYFCDCGCGKMIWEVNSLYMKHMEQQYNEHKDYLNLIKSVLNTREHIKK